MNGYGVRHDWLGWLSIRFLTPLNVRVNATCLLLTTQTFTKVNGSTFEGEFKEDVAV